MQDTGPQPGGKTQSPGFSLSLACELWDSKRGKMISSFLPELCLQRYLYPLDMKGGHIPASWVLWTGYPPYPSYPSLPGPWAQLWPGKGGGHEGGRPRLSFVSQYPYLPYIPNTRMLKKTVTPTKEIVAGPVKNWR